MSNGIVVNTAMEHPRIVLPPPISNELLEKYHTHPFGGHNGFLGTYNKIRIK